MPFRVLVPLLVAIALSPTFSQAQTVFDEQPTLDPSKPITSVDPGEYSNCLQNDKSTRAQWTSLNGSCKPGESCPMGDAASAQAKCAQQATHTMNLSPPATTADEETADHKTTATTPDNNNSSITAAAPKSTPTSSATTKSPTSSPSKSPSSSSPSNSNTQSASSASDEAQGDIGSCVSLQSRASQCCGNPLSCASPQTQQAVRMLNQPAPQGAGLMQYCQQMTQLGNNSSSINNDLSGACIAPQSSCQSTCASLAQKYYSRLGNCNGCAAESVYSNAASQLNSYANSCSGMRAQAAALGVQGLSNAYNSGMGTACQNYASSMPGGAPGAGPGGLINDLPSPCTNDPNSAACVASCQQNPSTPDCVAANQASQPLTGKDGFAKVDKSTDSSNVNDPADSSLPGGLQIDPVKPQGRQNGSVPNNTGGGIPGEEGSGAQAKLDFHPRGPAVSPSGASADIDKGFNSGGYSQPVGGSPGDPGFGSNFWGSGRAPASAKSADASFLGVDLKRFLPGAGRDPSGYVSKGREINDRSEDIWRRMSMKIAEKCRLGVLLQCD